MFHRIQHMESSESTLSFLLKIVFTGQSSADDSPWHSLKMKGMCRTFSWWESCRVLCLLKLHNNLLFRIFFSYTVTWIRFIVWRTHGARAVHQWFRTLLCWFPVAGMQMFTTCNDAMPNFAPRKWFKFLTRKPAVNRFPPLKPSGKYVPPHLVLNRRGYIYIYI
jgi:hypothetical protein